MDAVMDGVQFLYIDMHGALIDQCRDTFAKVLGDSHPLGSRFRFLASKLGDLQGADARFDCIMSPANSYGRLDGGYDWYISEQLAPPDRFEVPTEICQQALYDRWLGYAPPGSCTLVSLVGTACESNQHGCSYIALCPTMRVPEVVTWHKDIVYECTWSLFTEIYRHNRAASSTGQRRIANVLMTGLATGIGGVSAARCAMQTALAVQDFTAAMGDKKKWSSLEWEQIDELDRPLKASRAL